MFSIRCNVKCYLVSGAKSGYEPLFQAGRDLFLTYHLKNRPVEKAPYDYILTIVLETPYNKV